MLPDDPGRIRVLGRRFATVSSPLHFLMCRSFLFLLCLLELLGQASLAATAEGHEPHHTAAIDPDTPMMEVTGVAGPGPASPARALD